MQYWMGKKGAGMRQGPQRGQFPSMHARPQFHQRFGQASQRRERPDDGPKANLDQDQPRRERPEGKPIERKGEPPARHSAEADSTPQDAKLPAQDELAKIVIQPKLAE